MKRLINLLSVCLLLVALSGVASAYSYDYLHNPTVPTQGGYTTAVSNAIVETFDPNASFTKGWTWTGSYTIVPNGDNFSGRYSAPAYYNGSSDIKELTDYISVPLGTGTNPTNNGSVTVTNLGGYHNYFGLWWGSIDSYNTLEFFKNGTLIATIKGSNLSNPADGQQWAANTNKYVNIYFDANESYDSFSMSSTNFAFEADNIAIDRVPEPASMLLFGLGLLGLAGLRRRFKK